MWLYAKQMERLLRTNHVSREFLAKAFECSLMELNSVLNGKSEAGEILSKQLINAFGAADMELAINWSKTNESD